MPGIVPLFKLAASPAGRRALMVGLAFARSKEGKEALAKAKAAASGPQAQKIMGHGKRLADSTIEAARSPENRERIAALRAKVNKPKP